jgi:hypothetical protein
MNPVTILVLPPRTFQNFKDQHVDQASKQRLTPLLNSRGYEKLIFKNVRINKLFCAVLRAHCIVKVLVLCGTDKGDFYACTYINYICICKVKESRNRPGVAQRLRGGLGSQISMTFGTWRWWGCQPHATANFTPRRCSWYSFLLGAESTPGPWCGQKEYVTEKSSDITDNRSRDRRTSSAAP